MKVEGFVQYAEALIAEDLVVYPEAMGGTTLALSYCCLGLCGESGEVADKFKKILRDKDGEISEEDREALAYELGDVLWYWTRLVAELGLCPEKVAQMNLHKLIDRRDRGMFGGEGDKR